MESRTLLEESLRISQKNGEKGLEARTLIEIGGLISKANLGNEKEAIERIDKGIEVLQQFEMRPFIAKGHLILGEHYLRTNNLEMAIENLKHAQTMFQEMGMDFWANRTKAVISEAENTQG